ncbi:IstB ATP binding domain-containing protein [Candidatus Magnetomorum sp. HK-1]|nr:IstB ATP binding domain-containing protein [Candidatus Magnetomorum sp. HK-1]
MEKIPDKTRMKVIAHLETLRLRKIRDILDEELGNAVKNKSTALELLERLLSIEANSLIDRRIERRIKESKLPERKLLADFDFDFQKSIDKQQIMELSTLNFIDRKQGIILAGNSGTGKSYIAKALILCACQRLYRSRYTTASDMLKELMSGLSDESLEQKLKKYISPEVLLIDEMGFDRLEQESSRNASLFFKVIDGRYCKSSTIIVIYKIIFRSFYNIIVP